jgi:hypothetical protein
MGANNQVQIIFDVAVVLVFILKLTCFLLGYSIIRLGYQLMSEGVKGQFKFTSEFRGIKGGLASSSPGLLFVLLGTLLIGYALYVKKSFDLTNSNSSEQYSPGKRPTMDTQNKAHITPPDSLKADPLN